MPQSEERAQGRPSDAPSDGAPRIGGVPLGRVAREWTRIGVIGFGGPPVHIALLRELVVEREGWLNGEVFEDAIAACNMLPGPTSTQLAIFCAYRAAGSVGALVGGFGFIVPSVVAILALSVLFLAENPPLWVRGAGAGAGAVVAAVAVRAGLSLLGPSWRRVRSSREESQERVPHEAASSGDTAGEPVHGSTRPERADQSATRGRDQSADPGTPDPGRARSASRRGRRTVRWLMYLVAGLAAAATIGPYLVLVLLAAGALEILVTLGLPPWTPLTAAFPIGLIKRLAPLQAVALGGGSGELGPLAWTALKVGALSFGGGFVIVPLMQSDAVHIHHWMTNSQFLNAVALGQVTPGPVVATVAAVGYGAGGVGAGVLAAAVAFAPSFAFVLIAGNRFERLRADRRARAFLDGAGPAAVGAIFGAAITLAGALSEAWQVILLAAAAVVLLVLRRAIVPTLLAAGATGAVAALVGLPVP